MALGCVGQHLLDEVVADLLKLRMGQCKVRVVLHADSECSRCPHIGRFMRPALYTQSDAVIALTPSKGAMYRLRVSA